MSTQSQPGCLYFRGIPKSYQETDIRSLIRTCTYRKYASGPQPLAEPQIEEKYRLLNKSLLRIQTLRRVYQNSTIAGYLYFQDVDSAREVLRMTRYQMIDDKNPNSQEIHVMWREDDKTRRETGKGNIFIRNLHPDINAQKLCAAFEPLGRVLSVKISRNVQTGKSNQYGYVQFDTAEAAKEAIDKTNNKYLLGRQVTVEEFKPASKRHSEPSKFTNVHIRNLPAGTTLDGLKELCEKHVGPVTSAYIKEDPRKPAEGGTGRMFGAANFGTHEDAVKAIEVLPTIPFEDEERLFCAQHMSRQQREQQRIRRKKEQEELYYRMNKNVRVERMAEAATDATMKEYFSQFGTVVSCCCYKSVRSSTKHGYVLFTTAEEARKAVAECHGKKVEGLSGINELQVSIAQQRAPTKARPVSHYQMPGFQAGFPAGYPMGAGFPMGAHYPHMQPRPQAVHKTPKQQIGNKIYREVRMHLNQKKFEQQYIDKLARKVTGILVELDAQDLQAFESNPAQLQEGIKMALKKLEESQEYREMFPKRE